MQNQDLKVSDALPIGIPARGELWGLFFIALATLLFEVCLTRIFAVTLWYYFGFLAISLALIGTAVAAVVCFVNPDKFLGANYVVHLRNYAWRLALYSPVAIFIHLNIGLSYVNQFGFYFLLFVQLIPLFVAFFSAGMCITILLSRFSQQIGKVYFFDLAGASIGSLSVVPLLYWVSPLSAVFLVSALATFAELLFARQDAKTRVRPLIATVVFLALFAGNDKIGFLQVRIIKSYRAESLQKLEGEKIFEKWSPISRVVVFAPETTANGSERMRVMADAGAPTVLLKFDGDFAKYDLDGNVQNIPHFIRKNASCLVIGSGGGRDVLSALAANQRSITAVELNPITVELVTDTYADYIGRIFDDPRVSLHMQEGRNFVAGSADKYDIITIAMIDSWSGAAAGAYLFNENSLYTSEAIEDYVEHLNADGILSITRYYRWDEALRITSLITDYLEKRNIADIDKRIAVTVEAERKFHRATVLLKNGAFTPSESQQIQAATARAGGQTIYLPHLNAADFVQSEQAAYFRALINPEKQGFESRQHVINSHPKDISPPTDNRPFFFFNNRTTNIFESDTDLHAARRLAIPILYLIFATFFIFGVITIFVPLYLSKKTDIREAPYRFRCLFYFSLLGMGFMLIELSLIQRLTVFLGHPTYSFVVVLFAILLSSGIGSYLSSYWCPSANRHKLLVVLIGIVVLGAVLLAFGYDLFIDLMSLSFQNRILLSVACVTPIGLLLGMCFPMGIQIARQFHAHLVPWGWGVNGAFSVFASSLSLVLALHFGLKAVLGIGVACYVIASVIIFSLGTSAASIQTNSENADARV